MVFRTLFHLSVLAVAVCIHAPLSIPYYIFDSIRQLFVLVLEEAEERWDLPPDDDLRIRKLRIWMTPNYQENRLKEQARFKRQKEIVDKRNLSQSRLYQLPTELLCLIDDHLDPAGVLAIRATCSTFRGRLGWARVEEQANTPEGTAAKVQMSRWMIRQLYPKLCERERRVGPMANSQPRLSYLYLCQPCAARHPLSSFSPWQILAGPETRHCRPYDRVFRLCQHKDVGFSEVKDPVRPREHSDKGIDGDWLNTPGRIACKLCPKLCYVFTGLKSMDQDQAVLYERPSSGRKWYFRRYSMYVQDAMEMTIPDIDELFAHLSTSPISICPHVQLRDIDFVGCNPREVYLDRTSEGFWGKCYFCPAQFSVFGWRDPFRLVVEIHYPLGVRDCGPSWIAMSTPPRKVARRLTAWEAHIEKCGN